MKALFILLVLVYFVSGFNGEIFLAGCAGFFGFLVGLRILITEKGEEV